MHYDILSLGPARMDVFVKLPEEDVQEACRIDVQRCVVELGFGEKIPIKHIEFAVGGNTANNAVGLSRLGYKPAIVGNMGDDWVDQHALELIKKEGIDTSYIKMVKTQSGFGVVMNYQEERTILSYYARTVGGFEVGSDVTADWIYLTTAGDGFEQFYREAVDWAGIAKTKIAFNPGSRQIKLGLDKLRYVYAQTDILFVNREEAAKILSMSVENVKALLTGLKKLGPRLVVLTDGPSGAYAFDGKEYLHIPIYKVEVVERTGAGDAFGVGFMASFMRSLSVKEALKWGTVNSASVLGYVGPQAGLLSSERMQEWLTRADQLEVESI